MTLTLVLGGARSGKSAWAEARLGDRPVRYVATGLTPEGDPEWGRRVDEHRRRRPDSWETLETVDVPGVLAAADDRPVLVDCLTLWLTRVLDGCEAWDTADEGAAATVSAEVERLVASVARATVDVVLVSNEVGSGIVPATASGRLFRDLLGRLNAAMAAQCDEVVLTVAGIPLMIKETP